MHRIRSLKKHKVVIYYLVLCIVLILLVSGTVAFKKKSPMKTYFEVGNLLDITEIKAYQANQTESNIGIQNSTTSNKLILDIYPPAHIVQICVNRNVLDQYPNFISINISVSGTNVFIYTFNVKKAHITEDGWLQYEDIGARRWLAYSGSRITDDNFQIHEGLIIERGENSSDYQMNDQIEIVITDSSGHVVRENYITSIEIEGLIFIKEEEGRQTAQPIFLDYRFVLFCLYFLLILFVLPLIFLKKRSLSLQSLIIIGFLLRISIAPFASHNFDILIWKRAARTFYEGGEIALFTNWTSPPFWFFTILIFYAPYILLRILGLPDTRIYYQPILSMEVTFLKFPLILCDVLSTYLIYKICRKRDLDEKTAKMAAIAFLFNPFSIFISSIWGMFDSVAIFFTVLGFYLFAERKLWLSSLCWGLGVKWYTLGFLPFISIFSYFRNRGKPFLHRLTKSALPMLIGFGVFAVSLFLPHILHGNIDYLRQILEFRLKVGGGGGEAESLTRFFGTSFWRLPEYLGVMRLVPNFFLLAFMPLYLILLALFFISLKKSTLKQNDALLVLNNSLIAVLLAFYLTYPQLNPQLILWVLPHLILGYFLFKQVGVVPLIMASLVPLAYLNLAYFIIGFSVPSLAFMVQAFSPSWEYALSASLIPIAFYFFLKLLTPSFHHRIRILCKKRLAGMNRFHLYVFYISLTFFMFMQSLIIYAVQIQSVFILPMLISTIFLQGITFFSIEL